MQKFMIIKTDTSAYKIYTDGFFKKREYNGKEYTSSVEALQELEKEWGDVHVLIRIKE